jgi:hypothetical protein
VPSVTYRMWAAVRVGDSVRAEILDMASLEECEARTRTPDVRWWTVLAYSPGENPNARSGERHSNGCGPGAPCGFCERRAQRFGDPKPRRKKKAATEEERKPLRQIEAKPFVGNPRGPEFRGRRVALGLSLADLGVMPRLRAKFLLGEDGGPPPARGWDYWYGVLWDRFEEIVRDRVLQGEDWWDICLNPWSTAEIQRAKNGSSR